jgi:hypothetical protein
VRKCRCTFAAAITLDSRSPHDAWAAMPPSWGASRMDYLLGAMLFALFITAHALAVAVLNKSKGIVDPPSGANPTDVPPQGVAAAIASSLGHHSQHLGNSGSSHHHHKTVRGPEYALAHDLFLLPSGHWPAKR